MVFLCSVDGTTHYHVMEHVESAIAVPNDGTFWEDGYCPNTDEYGYNVPDSNMDIADYILANARLISTAPELYEALKKLVDHDEYMIEMGKYKHFIELERAAVVLKKARGES